MEHHCLPAFLVGRVPRTHPRSRRRESRAGPHPVRISAECHDQRASTARSFSMVFPGASIIDTRTAKSPTSTIRACCARRSGGQRGYRCHSAARSGFNCCRRCAATFRATCPRPSSSERSSLGFGECAGGHDLMQTLLGGIRLLSGGGGKSIDSALRQNTDANPLRMEMKTLVKPVNTSVTGNRRRRFDSGWDVGEVGGARGLTRASNRLQAGIRGPSWAIAPASISLK